MLHVSPVQGQSEGQQTIALPPDHPIALTDRLFQATTIDDRYMAASVTDQSGFLKSMSRDRDAFPTHSEHIGYQLLSHDQFIRRQPIVTEQKPAAQLLFDGMKSVAHGSLRHLCEQCLRVEQQQAMKLADTPEFLAEALQLQPDCVTSALNHRPIGRRIAAHEHSDADDAVAAFKSHFK